MCQSFFIHSSVYGHLGCFHIVTIVNSAAVNIGVHVAVSVLVLSGCMPSSGIAGSYDGFIASFSRNLHNVLRTSELKWTGMGEFNSDDHYIYYCGQESLSRNGITLIVNKRVRNAVLCYAKSLQSCPTLCDPRDGSTPGSPVPGILQARTLEWIAISFSNA